MEMKKIVSDQPNEKERLRVLVVDKNMGYLQQLDKMLRSCRYHVTACGKAKDALSLLRDDENGLRFDIVVADIDIVDMDGFEFLATLTSEFKSLPIVVMSSVVSEEEEEKIGMKGIEEGACAYFAKPISVECVKLLWQYVVRERIKGGGVAVESSSKHLHIKNNSDNHDEDEEEEEETKPNNKRNDHQLNSTVVDHHHETNHRNKKPRVCWKKELSDKFETAIKLIRLSQDEVVPKKILECMEKMGVKGLTRQNISSHLQKVRASMDKFVEMEAANPNFSSGGGSSWIDHHSISSSNFVQYISPANVVNYNIQSSAPPSIFAPNFFCQSNATSLCSSPSSLSFTDPSPPIFIPNDTTWELDDIFSHVTSDHVQLI